MNDFYFHLNTKFYFGRGVAADIAEEILNYGRKVFFIYDEIPAKTSGAYELIHKVCGENGIEVTDFTESSRIRAIRRSTGRELCSERKARMW